MSAIPPSSPPPADRPRRIGLYGGTFDPVHLGHLIAAQDALEQLHLDLLLFVPAYRSPFKTGSTASDAAHRLEMLRLSLDGLPGFGILDTEIRRAAPSYAIDTVLDVRSENPGAELFFLIGEDHLPTLHRWHRAEELHQLIQFAMQTRPPARGDSASDVVAGKTNISSSVSRATASPSATGCSVTLPCFATVDTESATHATALSHGIETQDAMKNISAEASAKVIRLPNSRHVDISASEIRRRVQQRLPIHFLVMPAVAAYIAAYGLYQN